MRNAFLAVDKRAEMEAPVLAAEHAEARTLQQGARPVQETHIEEELKYGQEKHCNMEAGVMSYLPGMPFWPPQTAWELQPCFVQLHFPHHSSFCDV